MDVFLSLLGGSEVSWPSPSEEAWASSGASRMAMTRRGGEEEGEEASVQGRRLSGFKTRGYWTRRESSRDDRASCVCLLSGHGQGHVQRAELVMSSQVSVDLLKNFNVCLNWLMTQKREGARIMAECSLWHRVPTPKRGRG